MKNKKITKTTKNNKKNNKNRKQKSELRSYKKEKVNSRVNMQIKKRNMKNDFSKNCEFIFKLLKFSIHKSMKISRRY